jgi:hypothetical protein
MSLSAGICLITMFIVGLVPAFQTRNIDDLSFHRGCCKLTGSRDVVLGSRLTPSKFQDRSTQ